MKTKIDVSVIIITYNTLQMTNECIDSIYAHTSDISFEIILVDNNSKDGSKDFFEKDQRIRYAYSPENIGFGRANNIGIAMAKGKYIFCLNSDTLFKNNALRIFYDYAECHEPNAMYGGWLTNKEGKYHSYSLFPSMADTLKGALAAYTKHIPGIHIQTKEAKERHNEVHSIDSYETDIVLGADMFIPYSAFLKYGVFDHNFFMYYEESDLQYRFMKNGMKRIIINGPEIIHLSGASSRKNNDRNLANERMWMESRSYFFRKHENRFKYILFAALFAFMRVPIILADRGLTLKDKKKHIALLLK